MLAEKRSDTEVRNTQALFFLVTLALVECGTICGTSSLAVTSTIGRVTELQVEPITRCTLCW